MTRHAELATVLYLIRHGTTEGLLPASRHNPPLAPLGVRQAAATRDFLAIRPIDHCYCSPLRRAVQTAAIVAAPHGLAPVPLPALAEGDAALAEEATEGTHFLDVHDRVTAAIEELLARHAGQSILVVGHHLNHRAYLAGLLGLGPNRAKQVVLDNCGISVVVRRGANTTVSTLNAAFHLQGVAA